MADNDDVMRELAAVRRSLENLVDEVETAEGAMPSGNFPGGPPERSLETVLKRVDNARDLADETADKLRSVLKAMSD